MTSYQDVLVLFALLLRFDKKLFYSFVLRTYFYVYRYACMLLRLVVNTQQAVRLLFSWYDVNHHLQKVNKSSGAHFQTLLSKIFLFFDVPQ